MIPAMTRMPTTMMIQIQKGGSSLAAGAVSNGTGSVVGVAVERGGDVDDVEAVEGEDDVNEVAVGRSWLCVTTATFSEECRVGRTEGNGETGEEISEELIGDGRASGRERVCLYV